MALNVILTETANKNLNNIFHYYKDIANEKVAQRIINKILDKTFLLELQPYSGQIEDLLAKRKFEFRYLVEGNYKIIYRIDEPNVYITTVFDCRQNPVKMQEFLKN